MTSPSTDRRFASNSSLGIKAPVKAATTANITLSGEQTIDGVSVVDGDRVLVKDQTTGSENGIYIADTSTWNRAPDLDGNRDAAQGCLVRVNQGTTNGGGLFYLATSGDIVIGTTSLTFTRESINFITSQSATASAAQTLVTVPNYQTGNGSLQVYINGLRVRLTADYTETSSTTITMTYPLQAGDEIDAYVFNTSGTLAAATASSTNVTDSGDYYVGTTVEAILQEIAQNTTADVGNASATLTYGSSAPVQRWNTTLTANRTVTLSTSNAKEGARFIVVRGSGATGNFTLAVGSICTLRAPGEWCVVGYDAGTSAWVLLAYGILPSAEVRAMGSDVGDAGATLTVGTSERTQYWNTALSADATVTLSATGAYTGARFRIIRTESATGNAALIISNGSAALARMGCGQFCEVEYTGSAWVIAEKGDIRSPNIRLVTLADDFLGEEIDGYKWQSLIGSDASCAQAVVLADQTAGVVRLTTGDDAGASMAINGAQLQSRLNWSADQGNLVMEVRLKMSAITNIAVYVGFTDQVSALEMPFTLSGTTLTSNATDAVGVLFDTAATTDDWYAVGVKADVDATEQDLSVAPTAATYEIWRIEVSPSGAASFYRNNTLIGSAMSNAITASTSLTPVIAAFARAASSVTIDVDYVMVQQSR